MKKAPTFRADADNVYTVHIGQMNDSANIALSVDTAHKLLDLFPNGSHDLIRRREIAGQDVTVNDLKFYR